LAFATRGRCRRSVGDRDAVDRLLIASWIRLPAGWVVVVGVLEADVVLAAAAVAPALMMSRRCHRVRLVIMAKCTGGVGVTVPALLTSRCLLAAGVAARGQDEDCVMSKAAPAALLDLSISSFLR